jgi:hypothetical protein
VDRDAVLDAKDRHREVRREQLLDLLDDEAAVGGRKSLGLAVDNECTRQRQAPFVDRVPQRLRALRVDQVAPALVLALAAPERLNEPLAPTAGRLGAQLPDRFFSLGALAL